MGGGLESRCVGHVYGANGAVRLGKYRNIIRATLWEPKMSIIL